MLALLFGVFCLNAQTIYSYDFEVWQNNHPQGWNGLNASLDISSVFQSSQAQSGSYSLNVKNQFLSDYKYISTDYFYIPAQKTYEISFWVKGKGGIGLGVYYCTNDFTPIFQENNINNSDWTEYKAWFYAYHLEDSTCIELSIGFSNILSQEGIFIDNIKIKELDNSKALGINNIKARVFSDGALFGNSHISNRNVQHNTGACFLVPDGNTFKPTIYKGNIWIGGKDDENNLLVSAETYYDDVFHYGPISNNHTNQNYMDRYNKVWKISKEEITYHINNYYNPNYIIPENIASWPGNGEGSESNIIAPYCDVNINGVYDPENGDYPAIRGDEALFFVFNDISDRNTDDFGEGLGLEIKAMAFAYSDTTDEDLRNTIFISYEISNLSSNNYSDTYFGLFNDMDLGYGLDDYMGFDSVNSMMYVFNGKAIDGPAEEAFDGVPPVQGAMLLNQNASKFISYVNSTHPLIGYPSTNQNYYNYLMGNKLNGSPITYGENGLNDNNPPTNYMYTGYPELNSGWSELDANNPAGDRRGIFSYGPFDLNSGNKICFDVAYPYALDNTATTPQGSLTLLRQRAQNIKTFYEAQEFECGFTDVGIEEVNNSEKKYILYPNPNTGSFRISSQELIPNTRIEIYSIIGNKVYERNINSLNQEITLDFRSGVYTFRIISKQTTIKQGKIIISK